MIVREVIEDIALTGTVERIIAQDKEKKQTILLLAVERNSGVVDYISVSINSLAVGLFCTMDDIAKIGSRITVVGEIKSRETQKKTKEDTRIKLYVKADTVFTTLSKEKSNYVKLRGVCVKKSNMRVTEKGRKITALLIGCHNVCVPVICFGKNAEKMKLCNIGDIVEVEGGRLQSREYTKMNERKVTYEVATSKAVIVEKAK